MDEVLSRGLFLGRTNTGFDPNGSMTRAMFVTVLGRLAGIDPAQHSGSSFHDSPAGAGYVEWAVQNGIVLGYGNGSFDPTGAITRQQIAVMLYRYAQHLGLVSASQNGNLDDFSDADQVTGYAASAMSWATGLGLIKGTGAGTLDPQGIATRAQTAVILYRFISSFNL